MQTEETKDNGTKAEGTAFRCCNPENFQKMFEKQPILKGMLISKKSRK